MKKIDYGSIVNKEKIKIKNNKDLERYYEHKWETGGYKQGVNIHGINLSKMFQKEREKSALKFLDPHKREIILDAGCGEGKLAEKIAKKCEKIYAVDISKNAFSKTKNSKNLIFKKMNIENLKFKDKYFDKLVCIETLEHVLYPNQVLREFSRVLKKGGILVLTYPTMNTNNMAKINNFLRIRKNLNVSEHLTEWDYDQIIKKFEKNKFKFIKSEGVVLNLGKIEKLMWLSRKMTITITKIMTSIKNFPRCSSFITIVFEKI